MQRPAGLTNIPDKIPLGRLIGNGRGQTNDLPRNPVKRNQTVGPHEFKNGLDVVLAVEDMDKLRKLGLGEDQSNGASRPTGIRGRIANYLNGIHG